VTLDFDPLAADYDRLRPAGAAWTELAERTLAGFEGCRRLVDIGCGTGRFAVLAKERLGGRVWGVDPSEEMLRRARARPGTRGIGWKLAPAERLPFEAGWFDAAHLHLVVHALADRGQAFAEAARVLARDGRLAIATFALEHFDRFFLNPYFPSIAAVDGARFPDPGVLAAELEGAGLGDAAVERISQPVRAEPGDVLERVRGRYISTLHLLEPAE
jgi:ubiquinone/menaquinone biosynthesis C-methylase UbiE